MKMFLVSDRHEIPWCGYELKPVKIFACEYAANRFAGLGPKGVQTVENRDYQVDEIDFCPDVDLENRYEWEIT